MNTRYYHKLVAATLASIGLVVPQVPSRAAETAAARAPVVTDVALAQGGLLRGQVVSAEGVAVKGAPVSLWHENRQVAATVSDENGQFSVTGVRGGMHMVVAGQASGAYRLWTAEAAPPAAQPSAKVVAGGATIIRAQGTGNGLRNAGPIIVAGAGVAALLGVTLGVDEDEGEDNVRRPASP